MSVSLHHLVTLDLEARRAAHPTVPPFAITRHKFSDASANDLTKSIVRWFAVHGHFSTRLASTGTYREDLKKFVASQQRAGLPDVFAVVEGRAVFVEVKHDKDQLSDVQEETIQALEQAGAMVFVARTFQGFYEWFLAHFGPMPDATARLDPFAPLTLGRQQVEALFNVLVLATAHFTQLADRPGKEPETGLNDYPRHLNNAKHLMRAITGYHAGIDATAKQKDEV